MTNVTTKPDSSQPLSETAVHLFDNWFDPIEAGLGLDAIFGFGREHLFVPACTLPRLACRAAVKAGGAAHCDISGLSLPKSQIRAYRWCSPPRIGWATMFPNRSIARVQGASLPE